MYHRSEACLGRNHLCPQCEGPSAEGRLPECWPHEDPSFCGVPQLVWSRAGIESQVSQIPVQSSFRDNTASARSLPCPAAWPPLPGWPGQPSSHLLDPRGHDQRLLSLSGTPVWPVNHMVTLMTRQLQLSENASSLGASLLQHLLSCLQDPPEHTQALGSCPMFFPSLPDPYLPLPQTQQAGA